MEIKEIISVVVAAIVGVVWAILELRRWRKEKRAKKMEIENNLEENPTRCTRHEERLWELEKYSVQFSEGIKGIDARLGRIESNTDKLIDLHTKG